jgi:hypothetical protein
LYSYPVVARTLKSRNMIWEEHARDITEIHTKLWSQNQKVRNFLEDLGVDGKITLKFITRK